ncbi:MAG: hypothetical protein ABI237_17735 [Ginsengibacter sp.]
MTKTNKFKIQFIAFAVFLLLNTISGCRKEKNTPDQPPSDSSIIILPPVDESLPAIKGKLVFHSYDNYGDKAKMYIYDFSKNQLTCINCNWELHDPINAHFNTGGTQIVFMAQAVPDGKWDIYTWMLNSKDPPVNLTSSDKSRDEDPKFSPDGKNICFKQTSGSNPGNVRIMDLNGKILQVVTDNKIESGMPYYLLNVPALIYAAGANSNSDIFMVNKDGSHNHAIQQEKNIQEYYPITIDSFSYLFSRWYSTSNKNDQVYKGYLSGAPPVSLLFNTSNANYSDAYPCRDDFVFLSSTRTGTIGGYDLYIANMRTGSIWSLSLYNKSINTSNNELGSCYSPK